MDNSPSFLQFQFFDHTGKALMRLYILGATPEKAAEDANTDIYNRRVTMRPPRGRR
jgi:putative heme degradation protein